MSEFRFKDWYGFRRKGSNTIDYMFLVEKELTQLEDTVNAEGHILAHWHEKVYVPILDMEFEGDESGEVAPLVFSLLKELLIDEFGIEEPYECEFITTAQDTETLPLVMGKSKWWG